MKKKLLFAFLLIALFVFAMAITASAEAPSLYIEFDVKLQGNSDYTTVYVENPESGNPRINLTFDFYSDLEFTQVVDKSQIVAMDFSGAVHYGNKTDYVDRFTTADPSLYPSCEEIKWFSRKFTTTPSNTFNGWTQLKRFDFGCITTIDYGFLANTGLVNVVIPESVVKLYNGVFSGCASLETVKVEGAITSIGTGQFQNCTSLVSVDLGQSTVTNTSMFESCTSLAEVKLGKVTSLSEKIFKNCTALQTVVIPSEVKSISKYAFQSAGITSIDLSGTQITKIQQQAFYQCASLKTVKMPLALSDIEAEAFRDCTSLEFVDFGNNTATSFKFSAHRTFYCCTSLKAVSLPRNTQYMNNGTFGGCTNLTAVYLGEAMIQINGNKSDGKGDGPTFAECEKMYFVQNAFSVTKADGTFYSAQEWEAVKPAKPDVYYFPTTLERICGSHNTYSSYSMDENGHITTSGGSDDLAFVKCYNLNKYLVFPEGFVGVDDGIKNGSNGTQNPDQRGDTLKTGLFHNCATAENPVTLVFLGRIDRISFDKRYGQTSYMTYMFANPANTGFDDTLIGSYVGDSGKYGNQNEMYVIFCNAPEGAQKYKINFVESAEDKNVPVLSATAITDGITHVNDIRNTADRSAPANCVDNEQTFDICFCGRRCNITEVEGTALGHDLDYSKDGALAYLVSVTYNGNFASTGAKVVCCGRDGCGSNEAVEAEPIFEGFGYSTREENGTKYGMVMSYVVNTSALKDYETVNNTSVSYGVLAIAQPNVSGNPLASDGSTDNESITTTSVTGTKAVDLIIWGSKAAWDSTLDDGTAVKDIKFYLTGYFIENGELSYFCGSNSSKNLVDLETTAYNDIKRIA